MFSRIAPTEPVLMSAFTSVRLGRDRSLFRERDRTQGQQQRDGRHGFDHRLGLAMPEPIKALRGVMGTFIADC